jgi:hypothetical protein
MQLQLTPLLRAFIWQYQIRHARCKRAGRKRRGHGRSGAVSVWLSMSAYGLRCRRGGSGTSSLLDLDARGELRGGLLSLLVVGLLLQLWSRRLRPWYRSLFTR